MIRFVCLAENMSDSPSLRAEHGLSVYIETQKHKILFDLGQSGLFRENAEKLGIDLKKVDTAIISHGHYDHGGGLAEFIKINPQAKIYLKSNAFGEYYSNHGSANKYIGLDLSLADYPNIIFTDGELEIDGELTLFSGVTERDFYSSANDSLYMKQNGIFEPDSFLHEQNLVITDGRKQVLITGCSHSGIVNIVRRFEADYKTGSSCDVIGGFHLFDVSAQQYEKPEMICAIADELMKTGANFHTCHCTGTEAYSLMKERMKDKLDYFSVGKEIIVK